MESQDTTFYVRNWRPNSVMFRYSGLKYVLERRGDRQDTAALPVDARGNPTVTRWLRSGILEEITKDDFVELAARVTDGPFAQLRSRLKEFDLPIEERTGAQPTTIKTELLDNKEWKDSHLSPSLKYMTEPLATSVEIAKSRAESELEEIAPVAAPKVAKSKTKASEEEEE